MHDDRLELEVLEDDGHELLRFPGLEGFGQHEHCGHRPALLEAEVQLLAQGPVPDGAEIGTDLGDEKGH